jgi:hypothetical protein
VTNPAELLVTTRYAVFLNPYKAAMEVVWPPTFTLNEMTGGLVLTASHASRSQRLAWAG